MTDVRHFVRLLSAFLSSLFSSKENPDNLNRDLNDFIGRRRANELVVLECKAQERKKLKRLGETTQMWWQGLNLAMLLMCAWVRVRVCALDCARPPLSLLSQLAQGFKARAARVPRQHTWVLRGGRDRCASLRALIGHPRRALLELLPAGAGSARLALLHLWVTFPRPCRRRSTNWWCRPVEC